MRTEYSKTIGTRLDPVSYEFVIAEADRLSISTSAVLRQAVDSLRTTRARAAAIEAEALRNEGAC